MKVGIISLGGPSSRLVAQECEKYFDVVDELDLKLFDVRIVNDSMDVLYDGRELEGYDCFYIRGSHKYAALQGAITRHYSRSVYMPIEGGAFAIGHDKFLTTMKLKKEGVHVPKTYYAANAKTARRLIDEVVEYPLILKVQSGTHGKGVLIAENAKTAKGILDILDAFKQPFIIQEFVATENTSDIRVIVCGKKVIASYLRVAGDGEFRSNVHAGGKRESYTITKEVERLALKSAKAVGCDIAGVDILNSKEPSVIEINLSPSFHSVKEVTGVNVVWLIAKELYNSTVKFNEMKDEKLRKKIAKRVEKNGDISVEVVDDGIVEEVVSKVIQEEEVAIRASHL
ncbi:MAG: ribosomal protein S6--L-glutamate ligase [Patescibacteria group bacterium]|jgi:ribosomal protein S6--L-glutamate ligase